MKNHYYVSIPVYGHDVYKYVGETKAGDNPELRETFERFGHSGLADPDQKDGPYKVLVFMSFRGQQIDEDGDPWPGRHVPKKIIFTWRDRDGIAYQVWCHLSEDENHRQMAYTVALKKGYLVHEFSKDMYGTEAISQALDAHRKVEESSRSILEHLRMTEST